MDQKGIPAMLAAALGVSAAGTILVFISAQHCENEGNTTSHRKCITTSV